MKKLLVVLAIGAFAASCNSGTSSDASKDSARIADSTQKALDSANAVKKDSTTTVADSLNKKSDSTTEAKKDSVKAK